MLVSISSLVVFNSWFTGKKITRSLYSVLRTAGEERVKFHNKKSAKNLPQIIHKTLYCVHYSFCGFFDAYSQRITYEVPTRYRADTGKDLVKST